MAISTLIAIMLVFCLLGIIGIIIFLAIQNERLQRVYRMEESLNSIDQTLVELNQDVNVGLDDGGPWTTMNMMGPGGASGVISMTDMIDQMKQSGQIDEDASDAEAMKKFFENLLDNQGGPPNDDDEPDEKWKGK